MTHLAVMALGSLGDVNPFLGIAGELVRRGHRVTFITNPYYEAWVRAAGFPFRPLGTKEEFAREVDNPDLWDANRALEMIFRIAASWSEDGYRVLAELQQDGVSAVIAPLQCFGARIAQERLGLPLISVMPNPILVESVFDPVRYPMLQLLAQLGPFAAKAMYALVTFVFELSVRPGINRGRIAAGLDPKGWLGQWVWSPDRIIGLWPKFLRGPQKDWLPQLRVTGFVTYDGPGGQPLTELGLDRAFLGQRPIVFTAGTAMTQGRAFFAAALEAAKRLETPSLFVTKYPEQLPSHLPNDVRVLSYAPFAELLPRCAAIVHHGGIGTAARALQAGLPQLIVPSAHDQFDNCHLLTRLGVADSVSWRHPDGALMADKLQSLCVSSAVRRQCAHFAGELARHDGLKETCDLIETDMRS